MSNTVTIEQYCKALEQMVNGGVEQASRNAANEIARKWVGNVRKLTPVKTGLLRRTWHVDVHSDPNQTRIILSNPTYYARYVEYGHRKPGGKGWVEGRFMLRDGTEPIKRDLDKIYAKHLKKVLNGYLG